MTGTKELHPRIGRLGRLVACSAAAALGTLAPAAGAAEGADQREPVPPSLLVVTFDTTRADALGVHGRDPSPTPNLDAFAAEGVRFERAISPSPVTVPSHASMFTGLVPRRHGIRANAPFTLPARHETLAERLDEAGYATAAVIGAAVLDRATGLDQGFGVYDDRVRVGPRRWFDWRERAANQVADAAIERLEELQTPFFLWVHLYDPHLPYVPPEPFASRFPDDPYLGEIAFADHAFGRLLDAARASTGELLVAVASDHGESLGEHGERDHGVFVYQATQHVFWMLAGPNVPPGRVIRERVGLIDVGPTLLALAGLKPPPRADGVDVSPLWRDERAPEKLRQRSFELESFHPAYAYGWAPLTALVRGPVKLIEAPEPELYHLGEDPHELSNLFGQRAEVAGKMRSALRERFADDRELTRLRSGRSGGGSADVDPRRLAQLRSLGYVSGGVTRPGEARPDPKQAIGWLAELRRARRALTRPEQPRRTGRAVAQQVQALLERNPGNHEARRVLASAWLTAGEPERAVAVLEEAVSRVPRDDGAWTQLGLARRRAAGGDSAALDRAGEAFSRALELRPRNAEAARLLARLHLDRGTTGPALALLRSMRTREALDPALATMLGRLEAASGEADAARNAFEHALTLAPGHVPALEALGRLAHAEGRFADAERHYALALEAAPSADTARTLAAIRLLQLEDRTGAIRAFRRALELEPVGPEADRVRAMLRELTDEAQPGPETGSGP